MADGELRQKGGAPLHEVKSNSPNGHSAGSLQSPLGSANKISPNRVDCYWFAQSGDSPTENRASPDKSDGLADPDGREASLLKDREERLRYLRERQAGDRHRKLEELKSAAMQAQKYRELQEEDRRRKIEEIKYRDLERRHLVEERKKQIWEAERDRRDTMLRKSQEREARIEAMRNAQRSSIGFAFGSCTPRMLDMESSLVFNRRSSSQHNLIPGAVLSRTQSAAPAGVSCTDNGDGVSDVPVRKRTSSTYSLNHRNRESAHRHTIHEAFFWENSTSPASSDTVADEPRNTHAQTNGGPTVVNNHRHHNSEITPNHSIGARQGAPSALFPWDNSSLYHAPQFGGASNTTTDGGNHRLSGVLSGSGVMVGGEDLMTKSLTSLASSLHRGRRKTDLIPTVPLKGEVTNAARTRSPGRAYSMTRLDQLSQPRQRRPALEALQEEQQRRDAGGPLSKTKSMSHLAMSPWKRAAPRGLGGGGDLRASRSADPRMSKSTSHLVAAAPDPYRRRRHHHHHPPSTSPDGRPHSTRSSPTRHPANRTSGSGSTSPGLSYRGSSPGGSSEGGTAKRLSQSMWQLSSSSSISPRPTRTSLMRRENAGGATPTPQLGIMSKSMLLLVPPRRPPREGASGSSATSDGRSSSRAPSSPSRPHSSMSQQSLSSHASQASSVSMRARSAPRRPRPMSVAGSMPDKPVTSDERQGRSSEKKATVPTGKPPRAKSVGADQIAKELESAAPKASPAAAAPAPSRRPPSSGAPKAARTVAATPKERPKIAPKPLALRKQTSKTSPVSSPTEELQVSLEKAVGMTNGSLINHQHPLNGFSEPSDSTRTDDQLLSGTTTTTGGEQLSDTDSVNLLQDETLPSYLQEEFLGEQHVDDQQQQQQQQQQERPLLTDNANVSTQSRREEELPPTPAVVQSQVAGDAGKAVVATEGKAKVKITTEEEAKAAMAEKRRLAREQAEREAELERQRQEELLRQEEERIRQEEEEQRLWEIEQEEMRLMDLERLNRAIRVQEQKEWEEKMQREEEAKQKVEKEKADLLAKEELEQQRKEAEEKLRREEEERAERRKRVEAIMSRTRGKGGGGGTNTPPVTTPTKSLDPADALAEQAANERSSTDSAGQNVDADGSSGGERQATDETQQQSSTLGGAAAEETSQSEGVMLARNAIDNHDDEQFSLLSSEQHFVTANNKTESSMNNELHVHTNGFDHHQVMNNQTDLELIMMDSGSSPDKKVSPLSEDMARFDMPTPKLDATTTAALSTPMDQLIDLSLVEQLSNQHHPLATPELRTGSATHMEHISNEDSVNFNITTIGLDSPFVDNYNKLQETTVSDLMS